MVSVIVLCITGNEWGSQGQQFSEQLDQIKYPKKTVSFVLYEKGLKIPKGESEAVNRIRKGPDFDYDK
jgi:hypothetical protein